MDLVVGMVHQQRGVDPRVLDLRQLVRRQRRSKLPALAAHRIVTKATGELALGPIHLPMQVIALHVADEHSIKVELMQVAAAVVQMIQVLTSRQCQRGQVAERIALTW